MKNIFNINSVTPEKIELFFRKSIGTDYVDVLPKNFFKAILNYGTHFAKNNQNLSYDRCMNLLLVYLKTYRRLYTSIKISDATNSSLIFLIRNIDLSDDKSVTYTDIPSTKRFIKTHSLGRKALDDTVAIFSTLMALNSVKGDDNKSFDIFVNDICGRLHFGDENVDYPRSIINYTTFQLCIEGYPYNTRSHRLYSIEGAPEGIGDAELIDVYYKNSNAVLDFLCDMNLDNIGESSRKIIDDVKILKNAYGMMTSLIALSSEESLNETILRKNFGSDNKTKHHLFKRSEDNTND